MRYVVIVLLLFAYPTRLAAQDDSDRGDLRIVVISDLNSSYGSTSYEWQVDSTIARIPRLWKPDLVLTGGDMIAGQSTSLTDSNVRAMWSAFDDIVAAPLRDAQIPLGFTIGNHDASAQPGYERDRNLAEEYWQDPEHHPGLNFVDSTHFPFQYTFTVGDIFVMAWDASSATVQDLDWVRSALASDAAASARMRIAVGHLPIYAVAEGRNLRGEVLNQPEMLRSLLQDNDVHTYVSGHHHAYYPGRRGTLQFLHAGALGSGERPLIGQTERSPNTVTIVDVDLDAELTRYTTLDATTLDTIHVSSLPKAIHGVNGFVVRRDLTMQDDYFGLLSPMHATESVSSSASGSVTAQMQEDILQIEGTFEGLVADLAENGGSEAALYVGINGRPGTRIADIDVNSSDARSGTFSAEVPLDAEGTDLLLAGSYYVAVFSAAYPNGELRAQLLSSSNEAPNPAAIESPSDGESVIVTGDFGQRLFKVSWPSATDPDGDPVTYAYQLASDEAFNDVWLAEPMGPFTEFKASRRDLHALLTAHGIEEGETTTVYHRIITTDGSIDTFGDSRTIQLSNGTPTSTERETIGIGFRLESVYPNPTSGKVKAAFELDQRARVTATVHNVLGQEVRRTDFGWLPASGSTIEIDVTGLPAGVYLVRLSTSDRIDVRRTSALPVTLF